MSPRPSLTALRRPPLENQDTGVIPLAFRASMGDRSSMVWRVTEPGPSSLVRAARAAVRAGGMAAPMSVQQLQPGAMALTISSGEVFFT